MNKVIRLLGMILLLTIPYSPLKAQPGFGDDTNDAPADGGITLLVLAGAAAGMVKLRKLKSQKDN